MFLPKLLLMLSILQIQIIQMETLFYTKLCFATMAVGSESIWKGQRLVSILLGKAYGTISKCCGL